LPAGISQKLEGVPRSGNDSDRLLSEIVLPSHLARQGAALDVPWDNLQVDISISCIWQEKGKSRWPLKRYRTQKLRKKERKKV